MQLDHVSVHMRFKQNITAHTRTLHARNSTFWKCQPDGKLHETCSLTMASSPFGWFEWFCDDSCVVFAVDAIQRPNFCSHKLDFRHFVITFYQSKTTSKMLFVVPAVATNFLAVALMASKKEVGCSFQDSPQGERRDELLDQRNQVPN